MSNPLIRKLEAAEALTVEDRAVLNALCTASRHVEAKRDIISQGDPPDDVHLVLDGIACRFKILANGARQIVAVLLPGDFCDLHIALLKEMDHTIGAVTSCRVVDIPAATIRDLSHHPRIARALWWATLVDEGTLREWLINIGRREAPQRMAHFFCEMLLRLQAVGLADDDSYHMPFRQYDLADLFGLTSVHVNRSLQHLRAAKLIVLEQRRLTIPDVARLMAFCEFDPTYLHLGSQRTPTASRGTPASRSPAP